MTTVRRHASSELAIVLLVGGAFAALAYSSGGYSSQLTAAVTVAIWWIVLLVLVSRFLPRRRIPTTAIGAGACLTGLAGVTALSMIWADDAGRAFVEVVRVSGYLGLFVVTVLATARTGARPWLIGIALGLVVVVVGALASRFDPSLFGGADRGLLAQLPFAEGRLSYPIGYWNGLGACIALGVALLAWLGVVARTRLGRAIATGLLPLFGIALYLTASRGGLLSMVVALVVLLILDRRRGELLGTLLIAGLGVLVLSLLASAQDDLVHGLTTSAAYAQGREMALATALCALGAGLARYLADRRLAGIQLPRVRARVVVGVVVVAGAVGMIVAGPGEVVDQFVDPHGLPQGGGGHFASASGTGRYQFWEAALDAFASDPAIGIGAGNYELWWNDHSSLPTVVLDAHSLYLETLAELGVVGFALLLGFLGFVIVGAVRRVTALRASGRSDDWVAAAVALLAAGLTTAAFEWTWELPAAFAPVIVAAALLSGPTAAREPSPAPTRLRAVESSRTPGSAPPRSQFGLGVATILLAWIAIWVAGDQLIASVQLGDSRDAFDQGQLDTAAQNARDAAAIQPWSAEPPLQLALVEKQRGDIQAALQAIGESVEKAPTDWRPWVVAAEINAAAGRPAVARFELDRARELSPTRIPVVLVR